MDYGPKCKNYSYKIFRVKHNKKSGIWSVFGFETKNMIHEYKINNLNFIKIRNFCV